MPAPSVALTQDQKVMGQAAGSPWESVAAMAAPSFHSAATADTYGTSGHQSVMTHSAAFGAHWAGRFAFGANRDFSASDYVCFQLSYEAWVGYPAFDAIETLANGGVSIIFYDSDGDWSEFYLMGSEYDGATLPENGPGDWSGYTGEPCFVIDRTRTPDDTNLTLNWASIAGFELHVRDGRTSGAAGDCTIRIGSMNLMSTTVVTAGETADKATFADVSTEFATYDNDFEYADAWTDSGQLFKGYPGKVYEPLYSIDIGDGTTHTEFSDSDALICWYPSSANGPTVNSIPRILVASRGVRVNQSASDIVDLDNIIFSGANIAGGEVFFQVLGNTAGACNPANCTYYYHDYVIVGHGTFTGCIFDDCEEIEIDTNSTLTNCTIRNLSATAKGLYVDQAAGDFSAAGVTFSGDTTGDEITIGDHGVGTYDLRGVRTQGQTINVHHEGSDDITVQLDPSVTATWTAAGGTVDIDNAVTVTLTLSGLQPNTEVRIYEAGTDTELDGVENSGTSFNYVYTYAPGTNVDIVIHHVNYEYQKIPNYLLGSSNASIPIQQDLDLWYSNP